MRAFIAIDPPQEIKNYLADIQTKLKKSNADVKWVKPQNIHLTLKFLGEIDDTKLHKIIDILNGISLNHAGFFMRTAHVGAFPRIQSPRVIWVGIDKGNDRITSIVHELEEKIEKIGLPKEEKSFSSHITIGRTKSSLNREKLSGLLNNAAHEGLATNFPEFFVPNIILFKSVLTPQGPVYETLKEFNLKTA